MAEVQKGRGGRPVGSVNHDKIELRAMIQERVLDYTTMRRARDIESGVPPEQAQEIIDEYDPVVSLAFLAVDRKSSIELRARCHSEVAQYVRPRLKSIEVTAPPEDPEVLERRHQIVERLTDILEEKAAQRRAEYVEKSGGV